jgi:Outer membrane protein beta-barrel domain
MNARISIVAAFLAAAAQPALAQESGDISAVVPRRAAGGPANAWEFGLGLGYTQGVGDVGSSSPTLTDIAHAGGEVQLSIGYRINPHWLVGLYGTGGKYTLGSGTPDGSDVWSATAGVQANYHFMPDQDWDPWVGLGAGWRGQWVSKPVGTDIRHGLELARVQVGLDYRVSPEFSVSPYLGASASMFLTQELAQETTWSNVHDPNVNFFFMGGIMGRFDIMGSKSQDSKVALASN